MIFCKYEINPSISFSIILSIIILNLNDSIYFNIIKIGCSLLQPQFLIVGNGFLLQPTVLTVGMIQIRIEPFQRFFESFIIKFKTKKI